MRRRRRPTASATGVPRVSARRRASVWAGGRLAPVYVFRIRGTPRRAAGGILFLSVSGVLSATGVYNSLPMHADFAALLLPKR